MSERNLHFESLRFTKEQKYCSSDKMEDLRSEKMFAVIDLVLITMPKNVICIVGGYHFLWFYWGIDIVA